jgi:hypothetical protein
MRAIRSLSPRGATIRACHIAGRRERAGAPELCLAVGDSTAPSLGARAGRRGGQSPPWARQRKNQSGLRQRCSLHTRTAAHFTARYAPRFGVLNGKLAAKQHATAGAIRSGVVLGCQLRNGVGELGEPVRRSSPPGAASAAPTAIAYAAACFATLAGCGSALHRAAQRVPDLKVSTLIATTLSASPIGRSRPSSAGAR